MVGVPYRTCNEVRPGCAPRSRPDPDRLRPPPACW